MKNLLILLLFVVSSCRAQYNSTQMVFQLQNYLQLSGYQGTANRVHVLSQNEDYILCTSCTVNGVTVLQGFGWRKWKLFNPAKVDTIWRVAGIDSTYFTVNGRVHSILDSAGGLTYIDPGTNITITGTGISTDHYIVNATGNDSTFAKNDLTATGDRTHDFNGHYLHIGNLSEFDAKSYAGAGAFVSTINSNGTSVGFDVNFIGVGNSSIGLSYNQVHLIPNPGGFVRIENLFPYTVGDSSYHFLVANGNGDVYLGDSLYRVGGGGGTSGVTSVGATATGALSFSGSPITSSGTLALGWTGDTTQYVRGDGSLATFPTTAVRDSLFGVQDNLATADRSFSQGSGYRFAWGGTWTSTAYHMIEMSNTGTGATGTLGVTNSSGSDAFSVNNSGIGTAILAAATSGYALQTTSNAINATLQSNPSTTNTIQTVAELVRNTSGTAAAGIGGALDYKNETTTSSNRVMSRLVSVSTDATDATRTAELQLWTTRNAISAVRLIVTDIPTYADETAATAGGLVTGTVYKTSTGQLMIKLWILLGLFRIGKIKRKR